jgi:hypothetical protein
VPRIKAGMNKRINFEDNIYIVLTRIRMIRDLLVLDTDADLFQEKTVDDIKFIDHALNVLLGALMANPQLIEREELLSHMSELEWQLAEVIEDFLNNPGNMQVEEYSALKERLLIFKSRGLERRKNLDNSDSNGKTPEEPLVSSNELSELLKGL